MTAVYADIIASTRDGYDNGLNVTDNLKHLTVPELQAIQKEAMFPYHVMALSLTGDLNISTMIRTACLHGAQKVWVYGRRKFDIRGCVGSQNYIEVERIFGFEDKGDVVFDLNKFVEIMDNNKLFPVFVELGGLDLGKFSWIEVLKPGFAAGKTPVLVLGNETNGIPDSFLQYPFPEAVTVSIPQRGVLRSFNVSAAMAAVTWDLRLGLDWL